MGIYNFYEFCCYFFLEFSIMGRVGRNGSEQYVSLSLFLGLLQRTLDWKEAKMEFFNFLNFFAVFLEFSITRRVRTKQNDNFYFLSFSSFSNLFWLEMKPQWYFIIFWIFLLFFWNFLLRVVQERNGTTIFIFSLYLPYPTYFGLK